MAVRAKFVVAWVESGQIETNDGPVDVQTITLLPVASSDPASENARFWKLTPAGEIRLSTVNASASEQFKAGREFYIDFTPVKE
jgi:hypothetical protein